MTNVSTNVSLVANRNRAKVSLGDIFNTGKGALDTTLSSVNRTVEMLDASLAVYHQQVLQRANIRIKLGSDINKQDICHEYVQQMQAAVAGTPMESDFDYRTEFNRLMSLA